MKTVVQSNGTDGTIATHEFLMSIKLALGGTNPDPQDPKKPIPVRAFYIIEANMDKGNSLSQTVIKFGVAGIERGYAWGRINDYRLMYGLPDARNKCKGFKIHYIGTTEYDKSIEISRCAVWKLEAFLKQKYRAESQPGDKERRGYERVTKEKLSELLRMVHSRDFKDEKTPMTSGALSTRSITRVKCKDEKLKTGCKEVAITRGHKKS